MKGTKIYFEEVSPSSANISVLVISTLKERTIIRRQNFRHCPKHPTAFVSTCNCGLINTQAECF